MFNEGCFKSNKGKSVLDQLVAVPKSELDKRDAAYQRKKFAEKKRKVTCFEFAPRVNSGFGTRF
jgi:hypothetical protein